jgi:phosphoenolpyruvate synthase/pyruvate phosphate dikinase
LSHIVWMHSARLTRDQVGGKGASLSELCGAGFKVPAGFCVTADAYRHFAEAGDLEAKTSAILSSMNAADRASVAEASGRLASIVAATPLPDELRSQILQAYQELASMNGQPCAVRSSSISEDSTGFSFAGLYDSFLNVCGANEVVDAVHRCYVSLWSERAVGYRAGQGASDDEEAMAVVVMGLVPSETSGIAFTAHPVTGSMDQVVINASFGLGEAIVSGRVTPDSFVIDKNSFAVLERQIYAKEMAIFPHPDGGGTVERPLPADRRQQPSLTDEEACAVARLAAKVEKHYGSPQDVEWGLYAGDLFVLQSRPITTLG